MSVEPVSQSFVPVAPEIRPSFFEPEPPRRVPPSQTNSTASKELMDKVLHESKPKDLTSTLTSKSVLDSLGLIAELANHKYEDTVYGTVCYGHPEAQYPHPGPMPENPNENKGVLSQFVQRGLSKNFREIERNYKNDLRHWQAQMNNHVLEVPYLRAKDQLIKGYLELLYNDPAGALNQLQLARQNHAFDQDRLNLELIANYNLHQDARCLEIENELKAYLPQTTLGEFGRALLGRMTQEKLYQAYQEACVMMAQSIEAQKGDIPIERYYPQNLFQTHLEQACVKLFNAHSGDFLALVSLYLLEETVLEPATSPDFVTEQMEKNFPHVVRLFDKMEENIELIEAHGLWDKFPKTKHFKENADSSSSDPNEVYDLIEELSTPKAFGDKKLERAFLLNAIAIQTERNLFEILPYIKRD